MSERLTVRAGPTRPTDDRPQPSSLGEHRTLVGREQEQRLLADRLGEARRGRGCLLLIEGEAGSGKSTLLAEAIWLASDFVVYRGSGREIDRDRPFGVIVEALGISVTSRDVERSAIGRELRASTDAIGDTLRYRVLEDIIALLEREALSRPLLVALDDLHWADDPSILVVHHLARRIADLPVLLLVTRRPPHRTQAADGLNDLVVAPHVDRVSLLPLDADEVALLAARILGVSPAPGLQALLAKAGGNPFFVTELLAALREDRSIDIDGSTARVTHIDARPELRMVILRRLSGLTAPTINVLRVASILGTTFSARDLAVGLGARPIDLVDPLDEAISAGVLRADDDRLTFRHDLVRGALYRDVPASLRNALHLQVAHALRASGAPPSQCAPHFAAGAAFGDDEAIECLRSAAADLAWIEAGTARHWLSRALELLAPADERRDEIVLELCPIVLRLGDAAAAESLAREALLRAQPRSRRSALVRALAAAVDGLDRCLDAAAVSDEESRADDLDEVERIRFAAAAVEYRVHVEPVDAEPAAREVLRRAESVGDELALRRVLAALYHVAHWRGQFEEAVAFAERIAAHAAASDPTVVTDGFLGRALARAGRTGEALEALRAEARGVESRRDMRPMALILKEIASIEAQQGHWDEAFSDVEASVGLALEFGQDTRHDEAASQLAILAIRRSETDRAARLLGSLRASRWFVPVLAHAKLAEATGDQRGALRILRDAWRLATATGRHSDMPRYAPDLVRLELAAGEQARAEEVAAEVDGMARSTRIAWIDVAALRCHGLVDQDPDRLLTAARVAREAGLADELAATLEDAGSTLARAGRRDDAIQALHDGLAYYQRVGAAYDERRVEAALRALGIRGGRRGPRARAKAGWASLTETERRVIDLAAAGLTNSEIGRRLFISGRTVERHLTHVYSKLGISSRVELAARAAVERQPD